MFVTYPKRKNGITVVRLVEGYRGNKGQVKQRILKTLGQSRDPQKIEDLKRQGHELKARLLAGQSLASITFAKDKLNSEDLQGQYILSGGLLTVVDCIYKKLGFHALLKTQRKSQQWNEILKYCVLARLVNPSSKLKSLDTLSKHFQKQFTHDQVLRMMDHLHDQKDRVKKQMSEKMKAESQSLDLLLFDVTTLYFESTNEDDLRKYGYSKDGKFNEVQVVLALLADADGLPINYKIFSGNTGEASTLIECLKEVRAQSAKTKIRITADRAMFSKKNLEFFESENKGLFKGCEYVVACPLRKLPKNLQANILDKTKFTPVSPDLSLFEFKYEGRRFIVSHSHKRAAKNRKDRHRLLEKIQGLKNSKNQIPVNKLRSNKGVAKYLKRTKGLTELSEEKIAQDELWDGLYGICTSEQRLSAHQVIKVYKRQWKIEEVFRMNKHTLQMRPIFHFVPRRIETHVLICFLSYAVLRYLMLELQKKNIHFGAEKLLSVLSSIREMVMLDTRTKKRFSVPMDMPPEGEQIYRAFDLYRPSFSRRIA